MNRPLRVAAGAVLAAACAGRAEAQRTLSWDELAVEARLDADGRLHVQEKQVMVLNGDWNGGERRFALRADQSLELQRLARIDPETRTSWPLVRGGLDAVDRYDWTDSTTLRWRSRLSSDPPFRNARLTYLLEYTYTNVLQPRGGDAYALEHDFAFAERAGVIRRFTLDLALDPAWTAREPIPRGAVVTDLQPGRGYVSRLGLVYGGPGRPAGVDVWGPRVAAASRTALLLVPLLVLATAWWREHRVGRLDPIPAVSRQWLEENVLPVPAEVIGAAWDEDVGSAEVAAVIARLQAEGKLESRVTGDSEMTLTLKAPLREFEGYEHGLLSGLFLGGTSDRTSTSAIRTHYRAKGFNPSSLIRPEVAQAAEALVGRDQLKKPSWVTGTILFWGGLGLLYLGGWPRTPVAPAWFGALFGLLFVWAIGHAAASAWRRRVDRGLLAAAPVVLLAAGPLVIAYVVLRLGGAPGFRSFTDAAVVAIALSFFVGVINAARSRRGSLSIGLRKRLCAVRRHFVAELRKPEPALEDAWFPYAVAFGLDKQVEAWFGRFGGASTPASSGHDRSWSSGGGSYSTGSSGPPSWTGGGGAFGGAGASGSWAAAVSGFASGVAAPSSSGSSGSSGGGGGGGGGSSSGGGGGGGW